MTPDPSSHPDDRWLRKFLDDARAGSADALGQLLEAFRPYLLLVANREADPALRPKYAPSDAVQDTLLAAQQEFPGFRGATAEELAGWLRRILLNRLVDVGRYFRADKRDIDREVSMDDHDSRHNLLGKLLAPDAPADSALMADEDVRRVRAALERLPDHYTQVILLGVRDGLTCEEIGRRLVCTADAARMLLKRAKEKLHELLKETDGN